MKLEKLQDKSVRAQYVVTHGGAIRTRTESLEHIQERQGGSGSSVGAGRAVENTYSFVVENADGGMTSSIRTTIGTASPKTDRSTGWEAIILVFSSPASPWKAAPIADPSIG
ncbi:unnamed protein product [Timema podura]|uniref:Uncharacterized protein n=1 Tax=Timema podura TaxID=61482 RepID=A0ABN7NJ06_TIMPD|nr:unnamed protein product [Timema podura]